MAYTETSATGYYDTTLENFATKESINTSFTYFPKYGPVDFVTNEIVIVEPGDAIGFRVVGSDTPFAKAPQSSDNYPLYEVCIRHGDPIPFIHFFKDRLHSKQFYIIGVFATSQLCQSQGPL